MHRGTNLKIERKQLYKLTDTVRQLTLRTGTNNKNTKSQKFCVFVICKE